MRILLVADLHYTLKQYDWLDAVAADLDLVVIAGDQLDVASAAEKNVQILVVLKYLRRIGAKTKLLVSSGNHDLDKIDANDEKTTAWLQKARAMGVLVDGDSFELDGALFTICPWWDGPVSREAVAEQLARDAAKREGTWVWVYHAPPAESAVSWAGKQHIGDADLLDWIRRYQPDYVLTGHIHESPFRAEGSWADRIGSTWVFNAGRQIGPVPSYVIFDTERREAAWLSLAGNETVRLDRPLERPLSELTYRDASRTGAPDDQSSPWWWTKDSRTSSTIPK
jgi:Icc-related predicted phosphoesterase